MRMLSIAAALVVSWLLRLANRGGPIQENRPPDHGGSDGRQGASGDTTTSRSSRLTARDPTASPTRRTTSSRERRSRNSTTASGTRSPLRRSRIGVRPGRSAFAGIESRSRFPPEAEGKAVFFPTTVDDYGEIWVDGQPAAHARERRRGSRGGIQRSESSRAQGPQAGQGLPDFRLRDQRSDLGRAVQLDLSRRHLLEIADKK